MFFGWSVQLLTNVGVVSRRRQSGQLPPVGGLLSFLISIIVGSVDGWICVCHSFNFWMLWPLHPTLDWLPLVLGVVSPMDTTLDHGGVFTFVTGGEGRVS